MLCILTDRMQMDIGSTLIGGGGYFIYHGSGLQREVIDKESNILKLE